MTQPEVKIFSALDGRLNGDDADVACGPNEWCAMENLRSGTTDNGVTAVVESVWGNTLRSTPVPSVSHMQVGSAVDLTNNRILYLLKDLFGTSDRIVCHYVVGHAQYTVLSSSQVGGGFGFHKWYPVHSARVVDGMLIYTDNYGEPKCIDIDAGIKLNHPTFPTEKEAYASPVSYETITLIKRPPRYRPTATKTNDGSFENDFIRNNAYQFTVRYVYKGSQESVFGPYSNLVPPSLSTETNNYISVKMPFTEAIDDYVQRVELAVRDGNTGKTRIVKQWDKQNSDDLAAIALHNAGSVQLNFPFYDNIAGIAVDDTTANTAFDGVPLLSEAFEVARYRAFFGNVLVGYDTPSKTSLTATPSDSDTGGSDFAGTWHYLILYGNFTGAQNNYMFPYVTKDSDPTQVYYFPAVRNASTIWNGGTGSVPSTVNLSDATIQGTDIASLVAYLKATQYPSVSSGVVVGTPPWNAGYDPGLSTLGATSVLAFEPTGATNFFKDNSTYLLSVAFYDRFRRKCGVVRKSVKVDVPIRTYSQTSFTTALNWTLSNTEATTEIPDWAYYYQIHITKSLTTRFFVQSRTFDSTYVKKNADGTFTYGNAAYASDTYGVALDLTTLTSYGLGYVFTEGDYATVFPSGGGHQILRVLGQDGQYVHLSPYDLGTLNATTDLLFELWTPYRQEVTEPFYETGDMMPVASPCTDGRAYSTLSGQVSGDVYSIERKDKDGDLYIVEAMNPNDLVWKDWDTDTGWVTYVDDIGQVRKNVVKWSDTLIVGSRVNGLNKFGPLNEKALDTDMGWCRKLQLASKVEGEQGGILIAICEKQTASLYMGEVQLYGATRASTLAQTADVIGTVNVLKGNFGTVDPTSVSEDDGDVRWFDANRGSWVQYTSNGLFPFSDYKMTRFWKLFAKQYLSMSRADIEALGSRPFIFSAVDPSHREVLISIPKLLAAPPKGYLPDYPSKIYPFDAYDGQSKTMVYKLDLGAGNPHWQGSYDFSAEGYAILQNRLFAFRSGFLYEQNTPGSTTFFGSSYTARIAFYGNLFGGLPKVAQNLTLEANHAPAFTYLRSEVPYEQGTDLMDYEWKDSEGVWYATVKRNKLQPTATGFTATSLLSGERMRSIAFHVLMEFSIGATLVQIKKITIGHQLSRGHQNLIPK